jgi:hypothetical protein
MLFAMTPSTPLTAPKGPTVATLKAIEEVLRRAAVPMTRYRIRQALGNRIAQPLLDEGLEYMADHEMVYDEGPGGRVLWIRTSTPTRARLRGA